MFGCERCGARYNSARAAAIRDCPRCLLRDDTTSPLSWMPDRKATAPSEQQAPTVTRVSLETERSGTSGATAI
jgi:predicted  nucleic acid-binding Zn-ribbon protein